MATSQDIYGWDAAYDATKTHAKDYITFQGYHNILNGGVDDPNEMVVDTRYLADEPENEKDDVAIINPDRLSDDVDMLLDRPRADSFETMKEIVLPPLIEEPEVLADAVHTWHIKNWRNLPRREHGPIFEAGGHPWRVLMFPSGNNVDQASFYLEQGYTDGKLPEDFVCCAQFGLVLWNEKDPTVFQQHTAHHRFTKEEGDWGFTRFVDLRKMFNPWEGSEHPLVENDEAMMTAYVRVVKDETGVLWHNFQNYDSKRETGYVGLKNQGATCYLNSLIQSLYFTNTFRKAVYQIPTQDEETLQNSAYTLQRLFYQLQVMENAVGTNELTKSFGWETRHIFEQQDVQELSRKLMERMEEKMKGTQAENALANLFSGKVRSYVSCINVDYKSQRVEDFWDVQLNVFEQENLEGSFKDYIMVETMDGENQYHAGDIFKLQDARKGEIFESFPDVLHLQLKRFQYDMNADAMMKVNSRYEFPETFDAAPYLADDADKSEPYIYQLHSVLVHSGDLNAGHYYAFIRPTKDGWFYKFDDDKVTKATMREVLEDNFGGPYPAVNGQVPMNNKGEPILRQNSAYMLVYIRQSRIDQVLLPVTIEDTPPHLQKRLHDEALEREAKRKEREESHLYLNVRVITDDTFRAYSGTDLTQFEQKHDQNPAAPRVYRILRKTTIPQLVEAIAKDTGCEPKMLRLWGMVNRQNKTVRPDIPIAESIATVDEAQHKMFGNKQDLRLWAERAEDVDADGEPIWLTHQSLANGSNTKSDTIVLFLKYFNVEKQSLFGTGHIYISREKKVEDIVPVIMKKMRWPEKDANGKTQQLRLWEEIKPTMIEPMKAKQSLKAAELQDGDIICFQKVLDAKSPEPKSLGSSSDLSSVSKLASRLTLTDFDDSNPPSKTSNSSSDRGSLSSKPSSLKSDRIEDARQFYDYLLHRKIVTFLPHHKNQNVANQEQFELALSSKESYDSFAAKVAEKLQVLPTHIRFWTINNANGNPKSAVKRGQGQTLLGALNPPYSTFSNNNQRADALYYEILEISLTELDTKKVLKVVWLSEGIMKDELFEILVPKNGNVDDLITALIKKAQLEPEMKAGPIRVYEVHSCKIHKELPREHHVVSITDFIQLVAERVPEEELQNDPNEYIYAFHFDKESSKAHGVPFKFHIKQNEKFSDTRHRLEKRTGLKGKNLEKVKFAVIKRSAYTKPLYLTDDDILWDVASADDDLLGLDHVDRSRAARNGAADLFLK